MHPSDNPNARPEPRTAESHDRQLPARPVETRLTEQMDSARRRIDQLVCWVTASDAADSETTDTAVASVRRPLRLGIILVGIVSFVTIVFGTLAPMESAAIAHGSVVVLNNRKTVQHLEGGVIHKILVKEGDTVKEGQPLILLNDVAARASLDISERDLLSSRASEARLIALREGKDTLEFDAAITEAAQKDEELAKTLRTQQELFASQREGARAREEVFRQRIEQAKEEISGLSAQMGATDRQLELIEDELSSLETLLAQGLVPKPRVLALQRRQEELRGMRGEYRATIAKARQGINETENELRNERNDFAQKIGLELKDAQDKVSQFSSQGSARQDVVSRSTITSPAGGIVTGLKYHTEGGVITPGSEIMDIVPQNADLVVEAKLQPTDIDSVHADMPARVVLSAYKTRNLPRLDGKVIQVSADAFSEQAGLQSVSYYTVQVSVDSEQIKHLTENVKLSPGMPAEVYIVTGSRSFVSYLFAPLTESMNRAFREQ